MKKSTLFGIISCVLVIGAAAYMLIKHINRNASENSDEIYIDENASDFPLAEADIYNSDGIDEVRVQSAETIYNRHKEAAEIISDATESINNNAEVISGHKEEFESMLDDLDMLSKEE